MHAESNLHIELDPIYSSNRTGIKQVNYFIGRLETP